MKPAWRSRLAFCSRCFSCSSCFLYLFTLFSRSSSLCLAWFIISCLLRSISSAESFLHQIDTETLLESSERRVVKRQTLTYILLSGQQCCRAGILHSYIPESPKLLFFFTLEDLIFLHSYLQAHIVNTESIMLV